jgi:TP901 family phage tail tape measure protein
MEGGKIVWILDADDGKFVSTMRNAESVADKTASSIEKSTKSGVDKAQKHLTELSNSFEQAGRTASLYISVPITAGFYSAVKSAGEFQSSMSLLGYTTGATAEQAALLSKTARDLGRDNTLAGVTASDAATSMTELSKAGLGLNDTLAASRGVLSLAKAGQMDFAHAANITAGALNAFKLKGEDAGRVADVLANGANKSQASLQDLGLGLQASASVAQLFGLGLEENITALAIFANNGIRASDAGTSLKTMLLSIATPSKEAAGLMKKIGFNAYDAQGNFVGLREVSIRLADSLKGMTEEQRTSTLATIFGSDATRAASLLAANAGESYDKMAAAIGRTGTAQEMAKAMMGDYDRALEGMRNVVSDVAIEVGNILIPKLIELFNWLRDGLLWFQRQSDETQKLFIAFGLVAASIGPILIGFSLLFKAINTAIKVWRGVATAIIFARGALTAFQLGAAGAMVQGNLLTATMGRLGMAATAAGVAMARIPFLGWIGIAIGLLAGLLIMFKTTETGFETMLKGMLAKVPGIIDGIVAFVTTELPKIFSAVVTTVMTEAPKILNAIVSFFQSVVNWVVTNGPALLTSFLTIFGNIVNSIVTFFQTNTPRIVESVVAMIKTMIAYVVANAPAFIQAFIDIVGKIADTISSNIYMFSTLAYDMVTSLLNGITAALPGIITAGMNIITNLINGIVTALPLIVDTIVNIVNTIVNILVTNLPKILSAGIMILTAIISGIISVLPSLIDAAVQIILAIGLAIVENLPMLLEAALQIIMALVNGLIENLPMIIEAAVTLFNALLTGILDMLPELINAALTLISTLVGALIANLPLLIACAITLIVQLALGLISALPQIISAAFQIIVALVAALIKMIPDLIRAGFDLIVALAKGLWDAVGDVIKGAGDIGAKIIEEIGKIPGEMLEAGKNIVKGLWDGIRNTQDWIMGKVKGFGDSILGSIKDFFKIKSPSRVMAEMGKYLIEGFGNGIEDNAKVAIKAATRASEAVLGSFGALDSNHTIGVDGASALNLGSSGELRGSDSSASSNNVYNITLPNVQNADDFAREFRLATIGRV